MNTIHKVCLMAVVLTTVLISGYSHSSYQRLSVENGSLVNENGRNVQLKGVSSHGIQWYPEFISPEMITSLKRQGVEIFRISVYPDGEKGYVESSEELYPLIQRAIKASINQQMYCIVDWHVLEEETPLVYQKEAEKFFEKVTADFPNHKGILFEICNEPNGDTNFEEIRQYANSVIPVIRENSPDAVILVGGPSYASRIDGFIKDPLPYDNLLFTLHYYPGLTDEKWLKQQIREAEASGQGVFITEWGFTAEAHDDNLSEQKSHLEKIMKWFDKHHISWTNWSFSDKDESYSFFKPNRKISENWDANDISESGQFVLDQLQD